MTAALGNLGGRSLLAIEAAQMTSWPARQTITLDGWAVRLSDGVTNRSTSINALTDGRMPLSGRLAEAVALFRAAGRRPVARLTPLAEPALDPVLDRLGWERYGDTDVQTASLDAAKPDSSVRIARQPDAIWIEALAYGGADAPRIAEHRALLSQLDRPAAFATIGPAEAPIAIGLGVVCDGILSFFEIATSPNHRRQGLGDRLCRALMAWGKDEGATLAALQVVASNEAAQALYARLGFTHAYSYWYRRAPC